MFGLNKTVQTVWSPCFCLLLNKEFCYRWQDNSDWRVDLWSDSEEQHVSEDSDIETADDLSDDSVNSVPIYQLWHDSRCEVRAEIYNFSAPRPHVNCCAVPHISPDSSPLDYFWLMFTEELLNIFFWQSQTVVANNTFKDRKTNSTIRYFYWWNISFSSFDNPDGTWATLYSILLKSHEIWLVYACHERDSLWK